MGSSQLAFSGHLLQIDSLLMEDAGICSHQAGFVAHIFLISVIQWWKVASKMQRWTEVN